MNESRSSIPVRQGDNVLLVVRHTCNELFTDRLYCTLSTGETFDIARGVEYFLWVSPGAYTISLRSGRLEQTTPLIPVTGGTHVELVWQRQGHCYQTVVTPWRG